MVSHSNYLLHTWIQVNIETKQHKPLLVSRSLPLRHTISLIVVGNDKSSVLTNRWHLQRHVHGATVAEALFLLHAH
jgi:hypothetical protein